MANLPSLRRSPVWSSPALAPPARPAATSASLLATIVGKIYRVEHKDDLNTMTWTQLGPDPVAMSGTLPIMENIGANAQRFHRVVRVN